MTGDPMGRFLDSVWEELSWPSAHVSLLRRFFMANYRLSSLYFGLDVSKHNSQFASFTSRFRSFAVKRQQIKRTVSGQRARIIKWPLSGSRFGSLFFTASRVILLSLMAGAVQEGWAATGTKWVAWGRGPSRAYVLRHFWQRISPTSRRGFSSALGKITLVAVNIVEKTSLNQKQKITTVY